LAKYNFKIKAVVFFMKHGVYHMRDLRCIRPVRDFCTARTIGTSFVHSRLD